MQDTKFSVQVNVPVDDLFRYAVSPWNAHLWMEGVAAEECSPWPPQAGVSHYRTKDVGGVWASYLLTAWEQDKLFELTKTDGSLVLRYTFSDLGGGVSQIDYEGRVKEGDAALPFTQESLEKLKRVLETKPL